MVVNIDDKEYTAEKIIKAGNVIRGYNGEKCVFIASGENISGDYIEEVSTIERLEALELAMLELILGGAE